MIVRYETYCGGRLLRIIEQVDVTAVEVPPDARVYVDGSWTWEADRQQIAPDIAQVMLDAAGETVRPGPPEPLIVR
jgi:hypothetical protein